VIGNYPLWTHEEKQRLRKLAASGTTVAEIAFTSCVFKDCNIDKLEPDEERGLYVKDNFFDRPLEERRAEFERRLAQVLAAWKAKEK
jgi:hypothetical protein